MELNVPVQNMNKDYIKQFHAMHEQRFSYARSETVIEIVNLRLSAIGETNKPKIDCISNIDSEPINAVTERADVFFDGAPLLTDFYNRESLHPGKQIQGPAIVTEFSATTVVPPNFLAIVDKYGNLILSQK